MKATHAIKGQEIKLNAQDFKYIVFIFHKFQLSLKLRPYETYSTLINMYFTVHFGTTYRGCVKSMRNYYTGVGVFFTFVKELNCLSK